MNNFSQRILTWFDQHGRTQLPWQLQPTPYRIWVSEIMLQQTQVNTVIPYYLRFVHRFPTVFTLATASLDEVFHLWSGLGYYARARHLHEAAQYVMLHHQGELPNDLTALMRLPGIGRSTAGAILALAFDRRYPILDGNVKRVLCRYYAIPGWSGTTENTRILWQLAEQHTPEYRVSAYTQAIMDLGATVCTRSTPQCVECPLTADCVAYQTDQTAHYPTPKPRKSLPVKTTIFIMLHAQQEEVLLEQRPLHGWWGGLWSFPECLTFADISLWYQHHFNTPVPTYFPWPPLRHTFSHFHLDITPAYIPIKVKTCQNMQGSVTQRWHRLTQPSIGGLASPVAYLLKQIKLIQFNGENNHDAHS